MFVADITSADVVRVLDPIWTSKTETASRLRGRIERILAFATTRGFREGDNPAVYRGHLDTILPSPSKVRRVQHHAALDYEQMGQFMRELRALNTAAAKALEFAILTVARSGEVRGARWEELDLTKGLWTIPAQRMKAAKEHVVPLSSRAIAILKHIPRIKGTSHVFAGVRQRGLSDATLGKVVKALHLADVESGGEGFSDPSVGGRVATCHGFRSTFRDWAAEQTSYSREVIEHALAHQLKDKSEAAYQRKTSVPRRVKLMQEWSDFCKSDPIKGKGAVIPIQHK